MPSRVLILLALLVPAAAMAQSLSVADAMVREPVAGTTSILELQVTLSEPASAPVTFQVSTSSESATSGADYAGVFGQFTIEPGRSSVAVPITIRGDGSTEQNETFIVRLTNASNATIANGTARITIVDSDPMTFAVNSSNTIDDGSCDPIHCSLREAVKAANLRPGVRDLIHFEIPGTGPHVIDHRGLDLEVFDPVIIDASTQPGSQLNTIASGATNAVLQIAIVGDGTLASPFAFNVEPPARGTIFRGIAFGGFLTALRFVDSVDATVEGCFIGTNAAGTQSVPNDVGILIENADRTTIGGASMASRNLIAGNLIGILIRGNQTRSTSIFQNLLGTTPAGNDILRNLEDAIRIENVALIPRASNSISLNVICGSGESGIDVTGSSGVVVHENWIGVGRDGVTPIPNDAGGIRLVGTSQTDVVANTIASNSGPGVVVIGSDASFGNHISRNRMRDNREMGIDLRIASSSAGPTPNDAGDVDSGANTLQNFPVIERALVNGSFTLTTVSLASKASTTYVIELFTSDACDASGHGEGAVYLDSIVVTTGTDGTASFVRNVPGGGAGRQMTAVAIEASTGNTSEFSRCTTITTPAKPLRQRSIRR